jgi:hypothetical protein
LPRLQIFIRYPILATFLTYLTYPKIAKIAKFYNITAIAREMTTKKIYDFIHIISTDAGKMAVVHMNHANKLNSTTELTGDNKFRAIIKDVIETSNLFTKSAIPGIMKRMEQPPTHIYPVFKSYTVTDATWYIIRTGPHYQQEKNCVHITVRGKDDGKQRPEVKLEGLNEHSSVLLEWPPKSGIVLDLKIHPSDVELL